MSEHTTRVWLITGCSGGLGRAFAEAALGAGERVLCTARKKESMADLEARFPQNAFPLALDVLDERSIAGSIREGLSHFGRIDVVVNNAGTGVFGAVEELTEKAIEEQFSVNTLGAFRVLKAVLPTLRQQRSGHIVNISSMSGIVGAAGTGAYNITKFALEGMSEALAEELKPLGIRVTIVEPGPFRTGFGKASQEDTAAGSIADYAETSGKMSKMLKGLQEWATGDPQGAAAALLQVVQSPNPPLRLVLGTIALDAIRQKLMRVSEDLAAWEAVTRGTDVVAAGAH